MRGRPGLWLGVAVAIPAALYFGAPAGASWAGTDDRIGELAQPAGQAVYHGPEWSGETEQWLFLGQSAAGATVLAGSLWLMRNRRRGGA